MWQQLPEMPEALIVLSRGDILGKDVLRASSSSPLGIMLLQSLLAMSVIYLPLLRVHKGFVRCATQLFQAVIPW